MKIYINLLPYSNQLAGTGYYSKRLLHYLQSFDKKNEYILLVSNLNNPVAVFGVSNSNFTFKQYNLLTSRIKRILFEQIALPFIIRKGIYFSPQVSVPLIMNKKVKAFITIHDLIPFIYKDKYSFFRTLYYKPMVYFSAKKADKILTVSENTAGDITKIFKINRNNILILHNFLDFEKYYTNEKQNKENYFITVCTIQPGKNLIRAIKAFKMYSIYDNSAKFLIIGKKGWKFDKIFSFVENQKLNEKIIFLGYVNEDELMQLYQKAKALVYVSYYEGFGIPPLEAMYFKCPVIVSNTSSFPEVVGKAGIYVDPHSVNDIYKAMIEVDKGIHNDKIKYMEDEVKKFNPITEVTKFLDLLKSYQK